MKQNPIEMRGFCPALQCDWREFMTSFCEEAEKLRLAFDGGSDLSFHSASRLSRTSSRKHQPFGPDTKTHCITPSFHKNKFQRTEMDGMDMSMNVNLATLPPNIDLPYAAYFCTAAVGAILVFATRRFLVGLPRKDSLLSETNSENSITSSTKPFVHHPTLSLKTVASFLSIERYLTNKLAYTPYIGPFFLPTVGTILLGLIFAAILVAVLLLNANLPVNSNRAGFLGLATISFNIALANKNSVITVLTGISHEKLNQLHRWLGTSTFVLATIHMSFWINQWAPYTWFLEAQLSSNKVVYGLATYTTLGLIFLTSLYPIRRYFYRFFVLAHVLLFPLFLILVAIHTPYAMRFITTGILLFALDQLAGWAIKTHVARARVEILPDRCARITLACDLAAAPRRAGQHVYLCIPSISWYQWHPFTISSVGTGSVLTLHAQAVGPFTRKLNEMNEGAQLLALVAGPYGEPPRVEGYDAVLMVAGGSGITFTMPILQDMLRKMDTKVVSRVDFVWCVSSMGQLSWFHKELEQILLETFDTNVVLTIRIFSREEQASGTFTIDESFLFTTLPKQLECDSRFQVTLERARAEDLVRDFVKTSADVGEMCVVACGPHSLVADVCNSVAKSSSLSKPKINLYYENYSL